MSCRCLTVEGQPLFWDLGGCPGPKMDGRFVSGLSTAQSLLLTACAGSWWGQAAAGGEGSTRDFQLVSSQVVTPPLSQPCSVFSLGKWTLKSNVTDDIFHCHTSELCSVFAEPSLMSWAQVRQRSFVIAPRFCHQALVPVGRIRNGRVYLCLSRVLHDGVHIFGVAVL